MKTSSGRIVTAVALLVVADIATHVASADSAESPLRRKRNLFDVNEFTQQKPPHSSIGQRGTTPDYGLVRTAQSHPTVRLPSILEASGDAGWLVEDMMWVRQLQETSMSSSMSMSPTPPTPPTPSSDVPTRAPSATTPTPPNPPGSPTTAPAPACLEGTTKEAYLLDLLDDITDATTLQDTSTPQGEAFDFMVNTDTIDVCTYPTVEQRYILSTFYYSTDGPSWSSSTGWVDAGVAECSWQGVTCSGADVVNIVLASNLLGGELPPELVSLSTLNILGVFENNVGGTIPPLPAGFEELDVESNPIGGPAFPDSLPDSLEVLRVGSTAVTGSIPSDIDTSLPALRQLWLAMSGVTGSLPPTMSGLDSLESLIVFSLGLTGNLPPSFSTSLVVLQAQDNELTGEIPAGLYESTALTSLQLSSNELSGEIDPAIGDLVGLTDLRLEDNRLAGAIPEGIGGLTSLVNLLLNNNTLTGEIPDVFEEFDSLNFTDLGNNSLTGPIPESLISNPGVRILYLRINELSGSIPPFNEATNLRDLYLNDNQLTGEVPEVADGSLPNLNEYLLHNNLLTGVMPESVCALRSGELEDLW
eukprot:CAMPEP_0194037058 /NCGR_PEP_ID=MMETSP0009_2-20130614/9407_1 /TAXON_ID=210454 /ORGANISM="Grammatophora oceanica, Strain CCMP 410" /LENGTH=586 /DNA_ID=CAMNT_0038679057 /DNA_START=180 /DNA_END=1937 /DNA_ORIENTATION=+